MITYKIRFFNNAPIMALLIFMSGCATTQLPPNQAYNKTRVSNITSEQAEILSVLSDAKMGEVRRSDNISIEVVEHYISAMGTNCRKLNVVSQSANNKNSLVCADNEQVYFVPAIYENINIGSAS